ncbi:uncharacterized protein LOC119869170 isoform X1 [Canis lupus familiaris]|uniref:uncharacterized protein LOC119869170 isoform X1 n=1 Tax=Canis lupus familiaris TaxID=9615 RepID=UPI0018F53A63|nr:uncharacterized protein LOC119869170 isoform X1 [Canis lupus familiaris]
MFSCCRPTSGGSGSQEPQGCGLFLCCRQWLQHRYQGVRAVIRRRRQSSTRVVGREREEGVVCPTASRSREVPCAANGGQRGLRGAGAAAGKGHQIVLTKLTRTELLEYKVRQLLLALQRRDVIYIFSFLEDYRTFCHHGRGVGPAVHREAPAGAGTSPGAARGPTHKADCPRGTKLTAPGARPSRGQRVKPL